MEATKFQCLICSEEKDTSEINKWNRNTCQQFCVIMCRYLNFNPGLVNSCFIRTMKIRLSNNTATAEASKYSKSNLTNEDKAVEFLCCDNCLILARSICDIYKSWSYLQLRLNRSIRLVAEMMKRTSGDKSRTISNKGVKNCQRSEFRKEFVKRVLDKKSSHDFPHLSLEKCCQNQPLMKARVKVENNIHPESNTKDYDTVVKTEIHSPYREDHYHSENEHLDAEPGESGEDKVDTDNDDDDRDIPPVNIEASSLVKIVVVAAVKEEENHPENAKTPGNPVRPTKCQTCGKVFASWNQLSKHMAIHGTERKFKCHCCGMRFKTQKNLSAHMRRSSHLRPPKPQKAEREQTDTSWFTILKEEPARYTKTGRHLGYPWKCNICGRVLIGNKRQHFLTHNAKTTKTGTGIKTFLCNECGRRFTHQPSLRRHRLEHHTPNYVKPKRQKKPRKCPDCGNIFASSATLLYHRIRKMGKCKYEENIRTKASLANYDTQIRTITAAKGGSKKLKCKICGKNFERPYLLKNHLISHSSEPNHQCEECGAKFKYGQSLQVHIRMKHLAGAADFLNAKSDNKYEENIKTTVAPAKANPINPMETKCHICGKEFQRSYLKRHLLTHSSEPGFQCEECGARFKSPEALRFHVRTTHTAEGSEFLKAKNERRRLKRRAAKSKKEDDVVDGTVEDVDASQATEGSSSSITN